MFSLIGLPNLKQHGLIETSSKRNMDSERFHGKPWSLQRAAEAVGKRNVMEIEIYKTDLENMANPHHETNQQYQR